MLMRTLFVRAVALAAVLSPALVLTQGGRTKPTTATYITKEEVDIVNSQGQGIDRNIRTVDIGHENFSVGIIHRGKTVNGVAVPAAGAAANAAGAGGGAAAAPSPTPCGRQMAPAPAGGTARRHHSRFADRRLLHRLRRWNDVYRRLHRQRTPQPLAGLERANLRRHGVRSREESREAWRHHHHSGRRGARMARHPRARGLSELPAVAGHSYRGLGAPGAQEVRASSPLPAARCADMAMPVF